MRVARGNSRRTLCAWFVQLHTAHYTPHAYTCQVHTTQNTCRAILCHVDHRVQGITLVFRFKFHPSIACSILESTIILVTAELHTQPLSDCQSFDMLVKLKKRGSTSMEYARRADCIRSAAAHKNVIERKTFQRRLYITTARVPTSSLFPLGKHALPRG